MAVPQIDYSFIGDLPTTYEAGAKIGRERELRGILGTSEAQQLLKNQDFGGLAALVGRVDPAYAQKLLGDAASSIGSGQFGVGAPVYTTDEHGNLSAYQPGRGGIPNKMQFGPGERPVPGNIQWQDFGNYTRGYDPRSRQWVTPPIPKGGQPEPGTIPAPGATAPDMPLPTPGTGSATPLPEGTPPGYSPTQEPVPQDIAPQQPTAPQGPIDFRHYEPRAASPTQTPGPQPQTTAPGQAPVVAPAGYGAVVGAPGSKKAQELSQIPRAQEAISRNIKQIGQLYEGLYRNGGIKVPGAPALKNAEISLESSNYGGQQIGRFFGRKNQAARDTIRNLIPNLIANMRQATGLSARSLDSNIELQFYMAQASNPDQDIVSNLAALDAFDQALGRITGRPGSTLDQGVSKEMMAFVRGQAGRLLSAPPTSWSDLAKIYPDAAASGIQAIQGQQ